MDTSIRVLHVDDDPEFAEIATEFLQRESSTFEIVTEVYASDALERLSESDDGFDCIVSDYALPDTDGLDFLDAVRTDYPNLPFILFTGRGSEEVARDALTGGATDYLQKQSGTEQWGLLANQIQNAVDQYHTRQKRKEADRYRRKLYQVTSNTSLATEEKINRLLELGCERLGVENGHVVRIDRQTDRHKIVNAGGSDFVQAGTTSDLDETYCRRTIEQEDILSIHNAPEQGWEDDPAYDKWGIGCYIGAELRVQDELFGTLCFVNSEPLATTFTEEERGFVDLMGRWMSHVFERQEHQEQLRREKERFELMIEEVGEYAIFTLDPDGYITSWNKGAKRIKQYDEDEIVGEHFSVFYTDEDRTDGRPEALLAQAEAEGWVNDEGWRVRKDGSSFWATVTITALTDEEGNVRGFGKVTRDMTDRRQRMARLRRIQEQFDTLPDIFYVTDDDGQLVRFNDRLSEVTGYTEAELNSIQLLDLIPEEDRDRFKRRHERRRHSDDPVTMESWLVPKDGDHIPHEFRWRRLADREEDTFGFVGIARDITERKEYERQLEQHIDRLNEFASVLTHDLRNPLSVAKGHLPAVADDVDDTKTAHIEAIDRSLDRIEDIIEDVLEITRTGLPVTEPEATDVFALAHRVWADMEKGAVHPDLTREDIPTVMADPSLLERLLMNLFRNAVEHGGREVLVSIGPLDDGFYIEDDGPGISAEDREAIFDWKYTTKAEGSGIGLKSVKQIVHAHDWGIRVRESSEGGARFEITGVDFVDG